MLPPVNGTRLDAYSICEGPTCKNMYIYMFSNAVVMVSCLLAQILHYAGDVTYSVLNFMDKNKDTFFQDLKRLLFGCKLKLLQEMWPEVLLV